ncbi:Phage protein [Xylella phage Bacata]|nr:tail protein [Xylella phage Bacata]CAA2367797.1 Phage protein [Xylella phage Bacata]
MVWVAIVVALVMAVVGELLRPKPKFNDPKPSAVGDFSFPTADASRVIPIFFGTCKMQGPNVVWFGDLTIITLKKKVKTGWFSSKRIVTGYNYYLGVQLVFAYGPCDEFIELRIDDKVAPISNKTFTGDVCSFYINAPTIISNDDPPNGVKGNCKLYRGTFEQPPNMYLSEQWDEPEMTAFRPLLHMVMEKCYLGNTDTPPPISIITRRCPNQLGLTGGRHNVNGDSNIACAVYEVMTNNMWGMKIPEDKIDVDSFIACGNTLADESIGISMLVQTAMLGRDLVAEMLRHADGVVYADPVTGLYTMTLAREIPDEEQDELLIVDDSNILPDTFEFSRSSWEMTKNTIIVQYTDRTTFETTPVQYQDLANIDVRGGMIDSEEFSYLGFSNSTAAMNTAARVSKMKASPLVSAKMSLNRIGYQLRPGSAFWLRKPNRGLANVLMRVIEINYGTLDDPAVKITAMEDIFAVNAVAYVPPDPSDWQPPVGAVVPFTQQRIIEAPAFGAEDMSRRYVITMGVPNSNGVIGYDVWTDTSGGTNFQQTNAIDALTPSGVLVSGLSRTGPEVDAAGFTVTSVVGVADIEAGTTGSRESGENLLLVGNELMAWQNIVNNGNDTYTVTGVYRGVLDTMPQDHGSGARVYFMSEGAGTTNEDGYGGDLTLNTKLTPKSIVDTVPLDNAAAMSVTTNARALRPLPPGRLRIDGAVVGSGATYDGDMLFSWAHRNRLDDSIASQADPSRTPEEGTTYNIRVYTSSNALLASALEVSSAASTGTMRFAVSGDMRIEIEAVRDGYVSWTKLVGYFSYTPASGATANEIIVDEPEYVLDGGGA